LKQQALSATKQRALSALQSYIPANTTVTHDPAKVIEMLTSYSWDVTVGAQFTQADFRRMNAQFDPQGCFGRLVLSCLLVEKFSPGMPYQAGEVVNDFCKDIILEKLSTETDPVIRMEMAEELLMYEEPHAVIIIDGVQFDVISTLFGRNIQHRTVNVVPAWELITASVIVDEALDAGDNPTAKNIHLQRAQLFAPDSKLVLQNMATSALELGNLEEAKALIESYHARFGVCARGLFAFAEVVDGYEETLRQVYPPEVIQLLEDELAQLMAAKGGLK
jgi:hypothetical protein